LDAPEVGAEVGHDTQAIVVVDHWGNVAALLHSINTVNWGDTGIVVGGIPIADAGAINRDKLVKMKPGESVPNLLSPVIALKAGKPVLAVASTGVSSTPETIRLVGGVLAGGADLLSLMSAPPLLVNLNSFEPNQSLVNRAESIPTGAYDAQQLQAIEAEGVPVREESLLRIWATRGTAVMVVIDQPGGAPRAVEVQNVSGFAESDLMSP
jgi:gamma-glutamyltranspeptidase/glutathione hydrolase